MRSHHHGRHSETTRRSANMADLLSLRLLSAVLIVVVADPEPGRIPKVYNALITSNQNLEPSKAYPVYQPVVQDAVFSYQPSFLYGGQYPFSNGLIPFPAQPPNVGLPQQPTPAPPASESSPTEAPSTDTTSPEPAPQDPSESDATTTAPDLLPPKTESPIPLNEFGLPPQVLPLGRINPAYSGFNQLGPFSYSYPSYSPYPGVRLYDPFDPFNLGPYSFPLYRPHPNLLGGGLPLVPPRPAAPAPAPPSNKSTPPSEPNDLNVLNYSAKDPAIPNVPPPPLPQGGLKSDKSE